MGAAGETRSRLLAAAEALFSERGFNGVTTRMLADAAKVNQAAFPYHFGSKACVYLAVAEAICDALGSHLAAPRAALDATRIEAISATIESNAAALVCGLAAPPADARSGPAAVR